LQFCLPSNFCLEGWALSRFYLDVAFSEKKIQQGARIIQDIKNTYIDTARERASMTLEVRILAKERIDKMVHRVGYPRFSPNFSDPKAMQELYTSPIIPSSEHSTNALSIARHRVQQQLLKIGQPTDTTE